MEDNLVIDDVINVYEGEFKPGYIKRNELRQCDGFCFYFAGNAEYIFENTTLSVRAGDVLFLPENAEFYVIKQRFDSSRTRIFGRNFKASFPLMSFF